MNLFLQLTKPENIPEDSEVLGKVEHWMDRILRMSWDDILHETIKLGGKLLVVVIIYFVARWAIKKMDGFIKRMLEKLNERQREIIYLFYFEQWRQQDIAEYFGVSQQNVSDMIRRVLKILSEYVHQERNN